MEMFVSWKTLEEKGRMPQSLLDFGFPSSILKGYIKIFHTSFFFIIYIVKDVVGM